MKICYLIRVIPYNIQRTFTGKRTPNSLQTFMLGILKDKVKNPRTASYNNATLAAAENIQS